MLARERMRALGVAGSERSIRVVDQLDFVGAARFCGGRRTRRDGTAVCAWKRVDRNSREHRGCRRGSVQWHELAR
jgi:hypothetical protein